VKLASSPHGDAALVRARAAGEREAQSRLFRQHVQSVHGFIHATTRMKVFCTRSSVALDPLLAAHVGAAREETP
jgi:hypothetical protein